MLLSLVDPLPPADGTSIVSGHLEEFSLGEFAEVLDAQGDLSPGRGLIEHLAPGASSDFDATLRKALDVCLVEEVEQLDRADLLLRDRFTLGPDVTEVNLVLVHHQPLGCPGWSARTTRGRENG